MTLLFNLFYSLLLLVTPIQESKKCKVIQNVTPISSSVYITDWEKAEAWKVNIGATKNKYFFKRTIPQLTHDVLENGLVLVYSKGYSFTEANFVEKPLALPFYFFSTNEQVMEACEWVLSKIPGEIELSLNVPLAELSSFEQKKNTIQVRYILLDKDFLTKQKLSQTALQKMSYQQVITLVNATP